MTAEPAESADGTGAERPPRLRASDADRAATAELLQDAVARGLLTHDEGGERLAAALSARFLDELPPLTVDLPPAPESAPPPPTAIGWSRLGSTVVTQVRSDVRAALDAGPRSRRFVVTALVALLVVALLVTLVTLALHGLVDGDHEHFHFDD